MLEATKVELIKLAAKMAQIQVMDGGDFEERVRRKFHFFKELLGEKACTCPPHKEEDNAKI